LQEKRGFVTSVGPYLTPVQAISPTSQRSAKGAAQDSLGQRPGNSCQEQMLALKARFIPEDFKSILRDAAIAQQRHCPHHL
jgi:hypothetical protein